MTLEYQRASGRHDVDDETIANDSEGAKAVNVMGREGLELP